MLLRLKLRRVLNLVSPGLSHHNMFISLKMTQHHLNTRQEKTQPTEFYRPLSVWPAESWCWRYSKTCMFVCTWRQACCGARLVPPPTVPSSIEGMVQLMYKSSRVGPVASIRVMQLLLVTVWAGSWRTRTHTHTHKQTILTQKNIETHTLMHSIS